MKYRQKEMVGIAVIAALMLATLILGGMFAGVNRRVYRSMGVVGCVGAAVLVAARAAMLKRRTRQMPALLCHRCGHEFDEVDATVCAVCGTPRGMSMRTTRNQRPSR